MATRRDPEMGSVAKVIDVLRKRRYQRQGMSSSLHDIDCRTAHDGPRLFQWLDDFQHARVPQPRQHGDLLSLASFKQSARCDRFMNTATGAPLS